MKNKYINLKAIVFFIIIFLVSSIIIPATGYEKETDISDQEGKQTSKDIQYFLDLISKKSENNHLDDISDKSQVYYSFSDFQGNNKLVSMSRTSGNNKIELLENEDVNFNLNTLSYDSNQVNEDTQIVFKDDNMKEPLLFKTGISLKNIKHPGPYLEFSPMVENHDTNTLKKSSFEITNTEGKVYYILKSNSDWLTFDSEMVKSKESSCVDSNTHIINIDASNLKPGSYTGLIKVAITGYGPNTLGDEKHIIPVNSETVHPVKITIWSDPNQGPSFRYNILGYQSLRDICEEGYEHSRYSVILDMFNAGQNYEQDNTIMNVEIDDPGQGIFPECCSLYSLNMKKSGHEIIAEDHPAGSNHDGSPAGSKIDINFDRTMSLKIGDDNYDHHLIQAKLRSKGWYNTYGDIKNIQNEHFGFRYYGYSYTPVSITTPEGYKYEFNVGGTYSNDQEPIYLNDFPTTDGEGGYTLNDFTVKKGFYSNPNMEGKSFEYAGGKYSIVDWSKETPEKMPIMFGSSCTNPPITSVDMGRIAVNEKGEIISTPPVSHFTLFSASTGESDVKSYISPFYKEFAGINGITLPWDVVADWHGDICPIVPYTLPMIDIDRDNFGSLSGESAVDRNGRKILSFGVRETLNGEPFTLEPGHYKIPLNVVTYVPDIPLIFIKYHEIILEFNVFESNVDNNDDEVPYNELFPIESFESWTLLDDDTEQTKHHIFPLYLKDPNGNKKPFCAFNPISSFNYDKRIKILFNNNPENKIYEISTDMPDYDIYPKKGVANWYSTGEYADKDFYFADKENVMEEIDKKMDYSIIDYMIGISNLDNYVENPSYDGLPCLWKVDNGIFGEWRIEDVNTISSMAKILDISPWDTENQMGVGFLESESYNNKFVKLLEYDQVPVDDDDDTDPDDPVDDSDEEDSDNTEDDESDTQQTLLEKLMDFIKTLLVKLGIQL
jgi:hypothetical protein